MVVHQPEGDYLDLGTPMRGAKTGYLENFFIMRTQMGSIVQGLSGGTDPRVRVYTKLLISGITDREVRERILNDMNARMEQVDNDTSLDNIERGWKQMEVCMETLGEVQDFYDEFVGITHRLTYQIA